MLYIIVNIFNYSQLEKLHTDTITAIKKSFFRMQDTHKHINIEKFNELLIVEAGSEHSADPRNVLDIAFHIKEIFEKEKEELFGYNIFITLRNKIESNQIVNLFKSVFLSLEKDEEIWVNENAKDFFYKYLDYKQVNEYWTVSKKQKGEDAASVNNEKTWINLPVKDSIYSRITTLISNESPNPLIHIYGPPGSGKTLLIMEIIRSLYKEKYCDLVPRTFTRFKKSSLIHPLLNSISVSFLDEVPHYLKSHELKIWNSKGIILKYLKSELDSEKSPDHIFEDFFISFSLYISAYTRLMETNLYPAIFICDDLSTYHKNTSRVLSLLINNFNQLPSFLPVIITRNSLLPREFDDFNVENIATAYLENREIMEIAHSKFPALNLREKMSKQILMLTKGQILPVIHSLLYLKTGSGDNNKKIILPDNQEKIIWSLMIKLDTGGKDILFSIYLTGGLLSSAQLIRFLIKYGIKPVTIDETILHLLNHHLIQRQGINLIAQFPSLRSRLEKDLGKSGEYLKELICDFIYQLLEDKKLSNLVLLFSFFMNHSTPIKALNILALLLKRKIDEKDIAGVKPFLNPGNFSFAGILSSEEKLILDTIISTGRIRIALLENNHKEAREAAEHGENLPPHSSAFHADLNLSLSRYYLASREPDLSIKKTKSTLIAQQETEDQQRIGRAYKLLGQAMLAGGKLKDAIDYFELSDRFLNMESQPYEKIQTLSASAVALYIKGHLSKSLTLIEKGLKIAESSARRNFELFFHFFKARINFDYGFYDKSSVYFQKSLALARIYSNTGAMGVIYAWLGRSEIYNGNVSHGIRILIGLGKSKETLFFLSEAYYFMKSYSRARDMMEKAMALVEPPVNLSDEVMTWNNGYDFIEGRVFLVFDKTSIFGRLLKAFNAFMQGLNEDIVGGIYTLNAITRGEKFSTLDPYSYFYYFLYASLLVRYTDKEKDDTLTILNQAIKQLQERASNIEEPLDRTKYLNKNLWNGVLLDEGRKRKLL